MLLDNQPLNGVTREILGAAIEVHRVLGPGLLESIYQTCLQFELGSRGLRFIVQQPVPILYKATRLQVVYRVDLIVEDLVIVEIKCVDVVSPVHRAQVMTYLRLTGIRAGLLINFNVARLIDGVKRLINPVSNV
jgi:GxxExxY protein